MDSPWKIKEKATKIARKFRKEDDTNYDEAENRYDAMRHIGGSMMLYQQYPDLLAEVMLGLNEKFDAVMDQAYGKDIDTEATGRDHHNNAIAAKLVSQFSKEEFEKMTDEEIMQFAREYVDSFRTDEEVDYADFGIDEDLIPQYVFGDTKEKP